MLCVVKYWDGWKMKISLNNLIFISIKLPIIKKKSKVGLKPVHIQWVQEFKSSPIVS
jgi:hypothetical protein